MLKHTGKISGHFVSALKSGKPGGTLRSKMGIAWLQIFVMQNPDEQKYPPLKAKKKQKKKNYKAEKYELGTCAVFVI